MFFYFNNLYLCVLGPVVTCLLFQAIKIIVSDFKEHPVKYKAAHIFFTEGNMSVQ